MPKYPRTTKKYLAALELPVFFAIDNKGTHADLYHHLNSIGWYWDVALKKWEHREIAANSPTQQVRIRIWANSLTIDSVAQDLQWFLEESGYQISQPTREYSCSPPRQNESRVYLTFEKLKS